MNPLDLLRHYRPDPLAWPEPITIANLTTDGFSVIQHYPKAYQGRGIANGYQAFAARYTRDWHVTVVKAWPDEVAWDDRPIDGEDECWWLGEGGPDTVRAEIITLLRQRCADRTEKAA